MVCELHSQIALVAAGIKAASPKAKVAYLMTDGAALPLAFSALVPTLKAAGLIDTTLTAGQAFGGDYECVTIASALIAARHIARADIVIVGQGPGNAGTGTRYGFSGIEQGMYLDLAGCLGGAAIGVFAFIACRPPRPPSRTVASLCNRVGAYRAVTGPCRVSHSLPPAAPVRRSLADCRTTYG